MQPGIPSGKVGMTTSDLPTNLEHSFSRVPAVERPRSSFDRSSAHKMTFDPNVLFPCYYDQVYPGDTMQVKGNLLARILAPLKQPIMDNMYLDWFAFFVPERIIWDNFQKSMGEQANPGDSTNFLIPQVSAHAWALHTLGDYFQVIGSALGNVGRAVNAMKFRAYNKIILDWFHDQNLVNSPVQNRGDGPMFFRIIRFLLVSGMIILRLVCLLLKKVILCSCLLLAT